MVGEERRDYAYFMRTIGILMMQPENVCLMISDYVSFYVFRGMAKLKTLKTFYLHRLEML